MNLVIIGLGYKEVTTDYWIQTVRMLQKSDFDVTIDAEKQEEFFLKRWIKEKKLIYSF